MLNSETLEVAIGMVFLFLTMALICTAIQEWIEGVMKWRAMDLERALRTLLKDPKGETAAQLYRHPMIAALFQGEYDPAKLWNSYGTPGKGAMHVRLHARRNLPSYIPAEHFATALIDLVARGDAQGAGTEADAQPITVESLRRQAAALPSAHLRRAVLAAIDHADGSLNGVRRNLQRWFDGTMDRASGWYKRRAQSILFVLGITAAVALNVDALHVMERLVADKAFRDAVVRQAETVKAPDAAASTPANERLADLRGQLRAVGMPIGWQDGKPIQSCEQTADRPGAASCSHWARIVVGWLVTAFAVMLGAPFWFDVLNRFMVLRSSVKPSAKNPEEAPLGKPTADETPPLEPKDKPDDKPDDPPDKR